MSSHTNTLELPELNGFELITYIGLDSGSGGTGFYFGPTALIMGLSCSGDTSSKPNYRSMNAKIL
jgi:hypothetical protein